MRRALPFLLIASACLQLACDPPLSNGEVLLEVPGFGDATVPGFGLARAELVITDVETGESPRVRVVTEDFEGEEEVFVVASPVPVPCEGGQCTLAFSVPAGAYLVYLDVFAEDRCGSEALVASIDAERGETITLGPGDALPISFDTPHWDRDDDGDGIENVLELAVCGRFHVADRDLPPAHCAGEAAGLCCDGPPTTPLLGHMTRFDGGADHTLADGATVSVAPFFLDATEVSWWALSRCVAAGACLYGDNTHPLRRALADENLRLDLPVMGLSPIEASELCTFLDKRLPSDAEWDFAAAARDDGGRARFPWDGPALRDLVASVPGAFSSAHDAPAAATIGCKASDPGVSANHRAPGRACLDTPAPVGSFPSSWVLRGAGAPVADLAGNVLEWTVDTTGAPLDDARVPATVSALYLRGGGFDSPPILLENDLRVGVPLADLERLTPFAGVRCARDGDAEQSPQPPTEPACSE
jgi:formylglycine-generating enzyme required for sulfatase activity